MYRILLIETGEYLYHRNSHATLIYSKYETTLYNGEFTSIFNSLYDAEYAFEAHNTIWLNGNIPIYLTEENKALFEIIEVKDV